MRYRKIIQELLSEFERLGMADGLRRKDNFPDEPPFFRYGMVARITKKISDGHPLLISASGLSSSSKEVALIKCLGEATERFGSTTYRKKELLFSSFNNLKQKALDPTVYIHDPSVRNKTFGWVKGFCLSDNLKCLLPAQLVYYSYLSGAEPYLRELNSTGAAGGTDKESTLLRGIYEIVERDAFLTMFLTKSKVPRVDIDSLKDKKIKQFVKLLRRYNLDPHIFDITNDTAIPSFMSIIVDSTGIGPLFTIGLKSSLDVKTALLGCLEEGYQSRPWVREISSGFSGKKILPKDIRFVEERAQFWYPPEMFSQLNFFMEAKVKPFKIVQKSKNKNTLKQLVSLLLQKKHKVYYADITPSNFRKIGYLVYSVVVPTLHFFYLHEHDKERNINMQRLRDVADFFGNKEFLTINPVPHPFL